MYRGVLVEQYNHSQFSNLPAHAVFDDLTIRGTGGVNAKTSGLGFSAFEVNTSGVIVDNALICLLYTSPSPRDLSTSRMPSSA